MKKGDVVKGHDTVKIIRGARAGCVGTVEKVGDNGTALVRVAGIFNGEVVDFVDWFALSSLGRNHGKG